MSAAPEVRTFLDSASNSFSHVIVDPATRAAAIVDPVLEFDPASGRSGCAGAHAIASWIESRGLRLEWIIETHVHADHLSAAQWLRQRLGGRIGIGEHVRGVQQIFGKLFNLGPEFARDGSQFDHLFADGERYQIGSLDAVALHTPGHTPACMSHCIGDAVFVGDTLFAPDYGSARCDFPGGDARALYRSIQRLYTLPVETRVFLCHDYPPPARGEFIHATTVGEQRTDNIHVRADTREDAFVALRTRRDARLDLPRLLLPAVQVNLRAGKFPAAEDNGISYLKLPVDGI